MATSHITNKVRLWFASLTQSNLIRYVFTQSQASYRCLELDLVAIDD